MGDRPEDLVPGERIGAYEVVRHVGSGGMGHVYLAKDLSVGERLVALKLLSSRLNQGDKGHLRFQQEIRNLARLRHEGIARLISAGTQNGRHYLVMDYVQGRDLNKFCEEAAALPEDIRIDRIARLISEVCRTVHYAHTKGIAHRDLKPANILVTSEGNHPMVLDFGIAKYLGDTSLTSQDQSPCTPAYGAPEQLDKKRRVKDLLIDVWAIGVILYESLTGRPPFDVTDFAVLSYQILSRDPVRPRALQPAIPSSIEKIILDCLKKDPKERPATARQVALSLDRALAAKVPARERLFAEPRSTRPRTSVQRASFRVALVRFALMALLGVACLGVSGAITPRRPEEGVRNP